ncbi:nuclear transport factor 2 family protein [Pedobacter agri]|uniref:nuclear transport factor 2 family protein n=1 Tax=Pedobacter agri TaxID=454586 RepID=UPI00277D470C|nr:nuclear transport factor 2 family protein [Pedobacter agri]MDQ1143005.1 ketosteroid isomerase-like protein [Pedobacter agri]
MNNILITKNNILAHEELLYSAMKNGNINVLDELLHNDLLFIVPSGDVITKEIDLDTYREGKLKIIELFPEIENLNIISDTAVVTVVMEIKGEYDGEKFEAKYRYIRFWKQFDDGVKVIGGSGIAID